jgi:predicted CoA-binding protein
MGTLGTGKSSPAIDKFLSAPSFAVVGASSDQNKFGYKCFDCYLRNGLKAYPINPNGTTVLGQPVFKRLSDLPEKVVSVSIITPPVVTEKVVDEAIRLGVQNLWMQPGADSPAAVAKAEAAGLTVIHGGPCLLVELGYFA